jgi:hypothetical protein
MKIIKLLLDAGADRYLSFGDASLFSQFTDVLAKYNNQESQSKSVPTSPSGVTIQ